MFSLILKVIEFKKIYTVYPQFDQQVHYNWDEVHIICPKFIENVSKTNWGPTGINDTDLKSLSCPGAEPIDCERDKTQTFVAPTRSL